MVPYDAVRYQIEDAIDLALHLSSPQAHASWMN